MDVLAYILRRMFQVLRTCRRPAIRSMRPKSLERDSNPVTLYFVGNFSADCENDNELENKFLSA